MAGPGFGFFAILRALTLPARRGDFRYLVGLAGFDEVAADQGTVISWRYIVSPVRAK